MLAEIKGKISPSSVNLTERSEDQLTGNFFGSLRYLPFNRGLGVIIAKTIYPSTLGEALSSVNVEEWGECIKFWPTYKTGSYVTLQRTEPDIVIEFDEIVILIEVKLYSGLSSNDDVSNITNPHEISKNQISREARLLDEIALHKKRLLLFWAPESMAHAVYRDVKERKLVRNASFGYITWTDALTALSNITTVNAYEKLIVGDLVGLLERKGFRQFKNFEQDYPFVYLQLNWWLTDDIHVNVDYNYANRTIGSAYYEFEKQD